MTKKLTSILLKAPMLLAFWVVVATGCHTPEDMDEIGPKKPETEEPVSLDLPTANQDKSSVIGSKNSVLTRPGGNGTTVEVMGSGAIVIKTPFKPSLKIPKPKCQKC